MRGSVNTEDQAARLQREVCELRAKLAETERLLGETYRMAAIGRLLAGIVHEINSPIGSLRSNNEVSRPSLEKLGGLLDEPERQEQSLEKARRIIDTLKTLAAVDRLACDRILGVIRNLKTFARGDQMDIRKCSIPEILNAAIALTQCEFRRRVRVITQYEAGIPDIDGYPEKLSQVFLNLLMNASQAIGEQGAVTITVEREADLLLVSIADTGHGIQPEHLNRLFQPGFTTKPPGVGTGLGLSMSRQIIQEKHGGTITVESEPEVGTTFQIRLPIARQVTASPEPELAKEPVL